MVTFRSAKPRLRFISSARVVSSRSRCVSVSSAMRYGEFVVGAAVSKPGVAARSKPAP